MGMNRATAWTFSGIGVSSMVDDDEGSKPWTNCELRTRSVSGSDSVEFGMALFCCGAFKSIGLVESGGLDILRTSFSKLEVLKGLMIRGMRLSITGERLLGLLVVGKYAMASERVSLC